MSAGSVAKDNKTSRTTNSERCSKMNEIKTISFRNIVFVD